MSDLVVIQGLERADVLRVLYNRARPKGIGLLRYTPDDMMPSEAADLIATADSFDYLGGRVMKVRIPEGSQAIDAWLYDRANGKGAAAAAISTLRGDNTSRPQ